MLTDFFLIKGKQSWEMYWPISVDCFLYILLPLFLSKLDQENNLPFLFHIENIWDSNCRLTDSNTASSFPLFPLGIIEDYEICCNLLQMAFYECQVKTKVCPINYHSTWSKRIWHSFNKKRMLEKFLEWSVVFLQFCYKVAKGRIWIVLPFSVEIPPQWSVAALSSHHLLNTNGIHKITLPFGLSQKQSSCLH